MALRGRMSQTTKTAMRVKEAMIARRGCLEEGRMVGKSMTCAFSREYAGMGRGRGVVGERDGGRGNASPQCVSDQGSSVWITPAEAAVLSGRGITSTLCTLVCSVHKHGDKVVDGRARREGL